MPLFDDVLPVPKKKTRPQIKGPKGGYKRELSEASKRRYETKRKKKKAERDLKKLSKIDAEALAAKKVLKGEKIIVTQDEFTTIPKKIKEFLADKEILFQPHPGPQTEFLAASEREGIN